MNKLYWEMFLLNLLERIEELLSIQEVKKNLSLRILYGF